MMAANAFPTASPLPQSTAGYTDAPPSQPRPQPLTAHKQPAKMAASRGRSLVIIAIAFAGRGTTTFGQDVDCGAFNQNQCTANAACSFDWMRNICGPFFCEDKPLLCNNLELGPPSCIGMVQLRVLCICARIYVGELYSVLIARPPAPTLSATAAAGGSLFSMDDCESQDGCE